MSTGQLHKFIYFLHQNFISVARNPKSGNNITSKKILSFFQDWTLQIKYVQKRDAGLYECQVSSHPPTSIFIQLNVVGQYLHAHPFFKSISIPPFQNGLPSSRHRFSRSAIFFPLPLSSYFFFVISPPVSSYRIYFHPPVSLN